MLEDCLPYITKSGPCLTTPSRFGLFQQGTISVGIDATDLFDRYEEDYEDAPGSIFPQIEVNKMHISQSIEVMHLGTTPGGHW